MRMQSGRLTFSAIAIVGIFASWTWAVAITTNPKAPFLHVNSDAAALDAPPITLADIGVLPGDRLEVTRLGEFDNGPAGDIFVNLLGIFSASDILLPGGNLSRVADAI